VGDVWYVSEDGSIDCFMLCVNEVYDLFEVFVWVIDDEYVLVYWFLCECLCGMFWVVELMSDDDVEWFFCGDCMCCVYVIEGVWLLDVCVVCVFVYWLLLELFIWYE